MYWTKHAIRPLRVWGLVMTVFNHFILHWLKTINIGLIMKNKLFWNTEQIITKLITNIFILKDKNKPWLLPTLDQRKSVNQWIKTYWSSEWMAVRQLEEWMTFIILSRQWCRENKSQEFKDKSCSWKMHNATVEEHVASNESRQTEMWQSGVFARGWRPAWICSFYEAQSEIRGWWQRGWCKRIRLDLIPVNEVDVCSTLQAPTHI